MKTKSILVLMLLMFTYQHINSQSLPSNRGLHPRLHNDGKVTDQKQVPLGFIGIDGKVSDVSGRVIGLINDNGEVTIASNKTIIGIIQKDGIFKSQTGNIITTDSDGTVMFGSKIIGFVDSGYEIKSYGFALYCFFSAENRDAKEIDSNINLLN